MYILGHIATDFTVSLMTSIFRRSAQAKIAASQAQQNREASELELIAQKQKETREKLKRNKVTMKKTLAGQFDMPYRPVDNITLPQEFHFATDERLGPSKHSGFASTLSLCLISTARYLRIGLVM